MSDNGYEVGFGKPPKESRFKKGQSGNPKGRPKGSRNFATDVKDVLASQVAVKEGERKTMVSTQKAALKRLKEKALNGDARALDRLLALAQTHMTDSELGSNAQPMTVTDREILARYVERQRAQSTEEEDHA